MSMEERTERALLYIQKCERRRQRRARRRRDRIDRLVRSATPIAGGICVLWAVMALI